MNKHVKFTLIQQISNTVNTDIDALKIRLKRTEDFWILKLDTVTPKGLNQELNNVKVTMYCIHYIMFISEYHLTTITTIAARKGTPYKEILNIT